RTQDAAVSARGEGMRSDDPVARRRADARAIFDAAVSAVRPDAAVRRHLRLSGRRLVVEGAVGAAGPIEIDMTTVGRVLVVGAGKASALMAKEVEACFGDRVAAGVVTVKYGHGAPLGRTRVVEAGHPVPDEAG